MSIVNTASVSGDFAIGRNLEVGNNADISGSASIGHDLTVEGWLYVDNVRGAFATTIQQFITEATGRLDALEASVAALQSSLGTLETSSQEQIQNVQTVVRGLNTEVISLRDDVGAIVQPDLSGYARKTDLVQLATQEHLNAVRQALADEYLKREEAQESYAASDTLDALRDDFDTAMNDTERGVYATFQNLETRLQGKADVEDVYSKSDVDTKLLAKPDKTAIDTLLSSKADASDVTMLRNQMSSKANVSDVYTKAEVYTKSEVSATVSTLALKSEVPDVTVYAKKTDVPSLVDLSDYAKKADVSGLVDLSTYAKKSTVDALTTQMANKLDKADASEVLGMENYALKAELDVVDGKVDDKLDVTSATTMLKKADLNTELTRLGYINASQVDSRISSQATLDEGVYLKKADLLTEVGKDDTIARKTDLDGLATKLELADEVNTVNTTLRSKADATALQSLTTTVAQKSDESSVSARIQNINTALNGKVSVSELNNYITRAEANQIYVSKEDQTIAPDDSEPNN